MIGVPLVNNFLIWLKVAMSEKVLLVCSSNSTNFRKAVNCLSTQSIFDKPELDFLCSLGDLQDLRQIQEAKKIWVFPHRRDLWNGMRLWRKIFKQRYDVVVVFWCLDTGRLLQKIFSLSFGIQKILVFNENLDCAFLSFSFLKRFLIARFHDGHLTVKFSVQSLVLTVKRIIYACLRMLVFPISFLALAGAVMTLYLKKGLSPRIVKKPKQRF